MRKIILIIASLFCLSGCAELIGVAAIEFGGYVASKAISKSITAIDESNKEIDAEEAKKKANYQIPPPPTP